MDKNKASRASAKMVDILFVLGEYTFAGIVIGGIIAEKVEHRAMMIVIGMLVVLALFALSLYIYTNNKD
ncbi:hypothetical protein AGMMS4956_08790 [Bacteroidia bacterium]|nr:hypothetical protein AGMMS4956_08790 [Bacteroidia bacterium]GHT82814.1 hypothetical protein FACS189467_8230 [Bacteroidia bacterium]